LGSWICFFNSEPQLGFRNKLLKFAAFAACVATVSLVGGLLRVLIWSATVNVSSFTLTLLQLAALSSFAAVLPALFGKGPGRILLALGTGAFAVLWGVMVAMGLFNVPRAPSYQYVDLNQK
jgi:hypothetical protein